MERVPGKGLRRMMSVCPADDPTRLSIRQEHYQILPISNTTRDISSSLAERNY